MGDIGLCWSSVNVGTKTITDGLALFIESPVFGWLFENAFYGT